jgi:hypothetical protein
MALTIASTPNRPERDSIASSSGHRVAAAYATVILARNHARRRFVRSGFIAPGSRRGCGDLWIAGNGPAFNGLWDQMELGPSPKHLGHGFCSTLEGLELHDLAAAYCTDTEKGLLRALDLQMRGHATV